MTGNSLNAATPAMSSSSPKYKAYTINNFRELSQMKNISEEKKMEMEIVGHVLPFKSNNYVVEKLIDWDNIPNDPIFILTFPQRDMLKPHHFEEMAKVLRDSSSKEEIRATANRIRLELNPHPAGQIEYNTPTLEGQKLFGIQHKYQETILFFPSQGQTCHAYCSFCFRWPQFVGMEGLKFALKETKLLVSYIRKHPEISDILITGGDPMTMKANILASCINALLDANIPHLKNIRIGTKALAFWPYRFLTDPDANNLLDLFKKVIHADKHLAIMAHFSHPLELKTTAVKEAIGKIRETGAQIRSQSPLLAHINDKPEIWARMWREQINLGCIPYYMFIARDTGAQHYFSVPLVKAWEIYREAYQQVTGLARTVRGPSMSADPGKIQILGVNKIMGGKVIVMRFLQGRNPDWVLRPFFAKYNDQATWFDDLAPAMGEKKFFFETS